MAGRDIALPWSPLPPGHPKLRVQPGSPLAVLKLLTLYLPSAEPAMTRFSPDCAIEKTTLPGGSSMGLSQSIDPLLASMATRNIFFQSSGRPTRRFESAMTVSWRHSTK